MKIDFANLQLQYKLYKKDIDTNIAKVLDSSAYVLGSDVKELETQLAAFTSAKHAISCSSGTDALLLAMMALDIKAGDEIITTPFTFIATAEAIALMHAKPVFVDIDPETFNIDVNKIAAAITPKTKAIMPVSLYGQPSDMDSVTKIAKEHNLKIIVDGAQSFGATYKNVTDSALGDISCTSFFPAKPLGCYGDGGALFTNDAELAEKITMLRVHGQNARYKHKYIGMGGRLDTIQAAVLLAKLPHYATEIENRNKITTAYTNALQSVVTTPKVAESCTSVWAQYTVRTNKRDALQQKLQEIGLPTAVHYPLPLHLQECFSYLGLKAGSLPVAEQASQEVISLPMNAFVSDEEINYITDSVITAIKSC